METVESLYKGKEVRSTTTSNYEVLRRASQAGMGTQAHDTSLPSLTDNIDRLRGLQVSYRDSGDLSFRHIVTKEQLEAALLQSGSSLSIDLSICKGADTSFEITADGSSVQLRASLLEDLASDVAKMQEMKTGQRLYATGTSDYRSKDSRCIHDDYGAEWSILADDSFQSVALVPGEESALVMSIGARPLSSSDEAHWRKFDRFLFNIKTRMLVVTDPVSNDPESVDWHSFKLIGLCMVDINNLQRQMPPGVLDFLTEDGELVMRINKTRSGTAYDSKMPHHGFLHNILLALSNLPDPDRALWKGKRFEASMGALCSMDKPGQFAAWNVVMAVRTVLEAHECGNPHAVNALKYSRTVNDFICQYMDQDVEDLGGVMSLTDSEKQYLLTKKVTVGMEEINLEEVGARNEEGYDHDKIGALNRPKLRRRHKTAGCNVRGGRGVPVMCSSPFVSYFHRGKRFRLSISDGRVVFSKRAEFLEAINLGRNIGRVEFGLDGIALEQRDLENNDGEVDDQILNALIHGKHGFRVAMWIWSAILFGTIAIDEEATKLCYILGADVKVDDANGYKVRASMTSQCLTRAVTYTDKDKLWIDIFDNLQLREVTAGSVSHTLHISQVITPLADIDRSTLFECSISSKLGVGKRYRE